MYRLGSGISGVMQRSSPQKDLSETTRDFARFGGLVGGHR